MFQNSGLILAASSSNSGKTTLSLGLQRLLLRRGLKVAPAKCGPDYIDPAFHAVASGRVSLNLDPFAMSSDDLRIRAANQMAKADMLFVEGVMGLFDGAAKGRGSTADLARHLKLPTVLVLDVKGQAQTAAAIAHGIRSFDPDIEIAGVVLNRVGSMAHEALLRESFDQVDIPVIGAVRASDKLALPSRHLGLVQAGEHPELDAQIDAIADHMAPDVDLDKLLSLTNGRADHLADLQGETPAKQLPPLGRHIAIARDEAFAFLYPHLVTDWKEQGADISFFSPLADEAPAPEADAIYLPGGYPELHLEALDAAQNFRRAMGKAHDDGLCIYGECGGYMMLGEAIIDAKGISHPGLDLLPVTTSFAAPKLKLGYRQLAPVGGYPWSMPLLAHEFHYSQEPDMNQDPEPTARLFHASNASGKQLPDMGHQVGNTFGSYAHVIAPA